jgi:alpha-tubulin suppressor-like RCC1 family protein
MNFNLVQVIDIQMTTSYGMAVTSGGTLYGWGKNENNIFGFEDK